MAAALPQHPAYKSQSGDKLGAEEALTWYAQHGLSASAQLDAQKSTGKAGHCLVDAALGAGEPIKRSSDTRVVGGASESASPCDSAFTLPKLLGLAAVEELQMPLSARTLPSAFAGSSWGTSQQLSGSVVHEASSTGEFTRGMELMANRSLDRPVKSSRGLDRHNSSSDQDEYLMRLLQTGSLPIAMSGSVEGNLVNYDAADAPSSVMPVALVPAAQRSTTSRVKGAVGGKRFRELRALILDHQDTFLQQIYDLHRCVQRQRQLVRVCADQKALSHAVSELKLAPLPRRKPAPIAAPPAVLPPMYFPSGYPPLPQPPHLRHYQAALPPPGNPHQIKLTTKAAGTPLALAMHYDAIPAVPQSLADPMSVWYAQHYGRGGPAMPVARPLPHPTRTAYNPDAVAVPQQQMTATIASEGTAPGCTTAELPVSNAGQTGGVRWWQDPGRVFGPSAVPELLASASALRPPPPLQVLQRRTEAESRWLDLDKNPQPSSSTPIKKRSRSMAVSDERTGQNSSRAGIGSTRPPSKVRGSGTSLSNKRVALSQGRHRKSGGGRNNESNSSGNCSGQHNSDGAETTAVPPATLESAASVLLSFSDCW